ncbi:DNA polymerase III subunit epsilon, partial [Staphylococcus aureus]|nr:DNA polymerase III subunit epsilon [Staphylococcus aureus]
MIQEAFCALDFETANGKSTIICSVGMVKVIDSQI